MIDYSHIFVFENIEKKLISIYSSETYRRSIEYAILGYCLEITASQRVQL